MKHIVFGAVLLLNACGGGGGSGGNSNVAPLAPAASPGGIFTGTFGGYQATAYVDEHGRAVILEQTPDVIVIVPTGGPLPTGPFSTGFQAFRLQNGSGIEDGTLTGSLTSRAELSGTYTEVGSPSGSAVLGYQASLYERPVSLAAVAGHYTLQYLGGRSGVEGTTYVASITLSASGVLSGSGTDGCVYSGSLDVPDPAYDLLDFTLDSSCSSPITGLVTRGASGLVFVGSGDYGFYGSAS